MNESSSTSAPESSALLSRDTSRLVSRGSSEEKKQFFCDYCKKPWHVKEKCWKLHYKPAHLKKKHDGKAMVVASDVPTQPDMTFAQPFSKDLLDSLCKLLQSSQLSSNPTPSCSFANQGKPVSFLTSSSNSIAWLTDSGTTDHMIYCSQLFSKHIPYAGNRKSRIADGTFSTIADSGNVRVSPTITLENVLHVPKLSCNLLSISLITKDHDCCAYFSSSDCQFQDLDSRRMIGNVKEHGGLYYFKDGQSLSTFVQDIMLWHFRLGHPSFHYLKKLFPTVFVNKDPSSLHCEFCVLAKHHRASYSSKSYQPSKPFHLIHSDIWGPSQIPTLSGKRWFITFIDVHTRLTWVYLLREKGDIANVFKKNSCIDQYTI